MCFHKRPSSVTKEQQGIKPVKQWNSIKVTLFRHRSHNNEKKDPAASRWLHPEILPF
jgi:hypothetical protein